MLIQRDGKTLANSGNRGGLGGNTADSGVIRGARKGVIFGVWGVVSVPRTIRPR